MKVDAEIHYHGDKLKQRFEEGEEEAKELLSPPPSVIVSPSNEDENPPFKDLNRYDIEKLNNE